MYIYQIVIVCYCYLYLFNKSNEKLIYVFFNYIKIDKITNFNKIESYIYTKIYNRKIYIKDYIITDNEYFDKILTKL